MKTTTTIEKLYRVDERVKKIEKLLSWRYVLLWLIRDLQDYMYWTKENIME